MDAPSGEKRGPRECLAYLQRQSAPHGESPPRKSVDVSAAVEKALEALLPTDLSHAPERDRIRRILLETFQKARSAELPSEWEDSDIYSILKQLESDVLAAIGELGLELAGEVAVGSLPTGSLNALAIRAPAGGAVVAVNQGAHLFLYKMAQVVAEFLDETEPGDCTISWPGEASAATALRLRWEDTARALEVNTQGHLRFQELLLAYVALGDAGYAQHYASPGLRMRFVGLLSFTADMFVVAHEYAHVVCGHTASRLARRARLPSGIEFEESVRCHKEEMEADALAFKITVTHNRKRGADLPLSYVGVDFLFSCLEIDETLRGTSSSRSHPSASDRRDSLRRRVTEQYPEQSVASLYLAGQIQWLMAELWRRNGPRLMATVASALGHGLRA
jgi:hypothetical protein